MMDEVNFGFLIVITTFSLISGMSMGKDIAFDNYKCTDERIENHEIVCYRWEKKP